MNNLSTERLVEAIRDLPPTTPMVTGLAKALNIGERAAGSAVARMVQQGYLGVGRSGLFITRK